LPWLGASASPHVSGNHGAEEPVAEVFTQRVGHLLRQVGPIIVHGEQDTFNIELRVESGAHPLQRGNQLGDALQGKVFACMGTMSVSGGGRAR